MDQHRSKQIEDIFHAARECKPGQRAAFLAQACAGDEELHDAVTSLLAAREQAGEFLDPAELHISTEHILRAEAGQSVAVVPATPHVHNHKDYSSQIFCDRYIIEEELGHGGIGVVYKARDTKFPELKPALHVAIKILLEDAAKNEFTAKHFRQEVEALARIAHPAIVKVLDQGEAPDGQPFFVMEFIAGRSLRALLEAGTVDIKLTAHLIRQISQALSAAHAKEVIHRDLKPDNIMLQSLGDGEEHVKLIDFGIAKVKDSQVGKTTINPVFAGSLPYMASEQLSLLLPSPASDLYALSVITYELLTGRRPFTPNGEDFQDAIKQLLEMQKAGLKAMPQDLRYGVPVDVGRLLRAGLSYNPQSRNQWSKDPKKLAKVFGAQLADALTPPLPPEPGPPLADALTPPLPPKPRKLLPLIAVSCLLLGAVLGVVGARWWLVASPPSSVVAALPSPAPSVASHEPPEKNPAPVPGSPKPTPVPSPTRPPKGPGGSVSQQVAFHLGRCRVLYSAMQYAPAITACNEALRLDPKNRAAQSLRQKVIATQETLK